MRLHFGPVPLSTDFAPEQEGWTRLREPSPTGLQVIAVPIALLTAAALIWAWNHLTPLGWGGFQVIVVKNSPDQPGWLQAVKALGQMGLGLLLLITVHELLHAFATPSWGMTSQTLIGVWPTRLLFYAAYLGPLSRARFLAVFATPLVVLTLAPLFFCAFVGMAHGPTATVSIVNGACACGDIAGMAMIGWQVPREAIVRNQSWCTWWKLPQ